jgi:hypothetical protein
MNTNPQAVKHLNWRQIEARTKVEFHLQPAPQRLRFSRQRRSWLNSLQPTVLAFPGFFERKTEPDNHESGLNSLQLRGLASPIVIKRKKESNNYEGSTVQDTACGCTICKPFEPPYCPPARFTPPVLKTFEPTAPTLPLLAKRMAVRFARDNKGIRVEDIVKQLHSDPSLIHLRSRITGGSVWEALRRRFDEEMVVEYATQKQYACSCSAALDTIAKDLWYKTDLNLTMITLLIQKQGFTTFRARNLPSVLYAAGIRSGRALGSLAQRGWGNNESFAVLGRAFELGMGVETAIEYFHEQGFGKIGGYEQVEEMLEYYEQLYYEKIKKD